MITVNENILNALNAPARRIDARVELYKCSALQNDGYNRELLATFCGDGALIDFKVERVADDGKFFGFGICQKLTVNLRDKERAININKGQVLEVSFGIDSKYTYPCALFQVEEISRNENNNNLKVIAYDFLYKAGEHRVSELKLTEYTPRSFIAACALLLNLPLKIEVDDAVFDLPYPNGANFEGSETLREALNAVAEATQTIFFVDWDWRLTFRRLKKDGEPVLHIDRNKYFELKNKTSRTLAAICHATELGDNVEAETGNPGAVQYIRNNPFWDLRDDIDTLLNNALAVVGGITISQFDCSWRGNYALEIGDKIAIETKDGDILTAYVLNDTLTYNGGLREQTEWSFTEHNAETASNPVNLGDALRQTFARVNKAEGYIELVAKDTQESLSQTLEEMAALRIQSDEISAEVSRVETKFDGETSNLNTKITQTAEGITSEVNRVETKADGYNTTLNSKIDQTAESIRSEVSAVEKKADGYNTTLNSKIDQTAGSITSEVSRVEKKADGYNTTLNSKIEQTASSITSEINRVETKVNSSTTSLNSKIDQTAESIRSEVSRVEDLIDGSGSSTSSLIQQTADSLTAEINRVENKADGYNTTLSSQIQQTANDISLKVNKDNIISAINLSPESIDISADKLNLSGYVTVNSLAGNGTTTINGSNITTGTISADRINMTGAIDWSDLSQSCKNTVASYAGSDGEDADLPDYIKSTYIDEVEIRSPKITGNDIQVYNTFQTIGTIGSSAAITGYVGAAKGKIDNNTTTYGVALSSSWDANNYDVAENYVIVTNAGARMTGGNNYFYIASSGSWIETNTGDLKITTPNGTVTVNGVDLGAILSGNNKMSDYVVEQGKSNNWTYRKWKSGIAECWCKKSIATTITNAWGSLYTSGGLESSNLDFPFTFSESPVVNVSCCNNGAGVFIIASGSWGPLSTTSTGMFELVRAVSSGTANTYVLCYQVMGRWK